MQEIPARQRSPPKGGREPQARMAGPASGWGFQGLMAALGVWPEDPGLCELRDPVCLSHCMSLTSGHSSDTRHIHNTRHASQPISSHNHYEVLPPHREGTEAQKREVPCSRRCW